MKAKRIKLPKQVVQELGIDLDKLNEKVQNMVDRKFAKGFESALQSTDLVEEYKSFDKNEMIAMFMDAASESGFLRYKLEKILSSDAIDISKMTAILSKDIDEDDIKKSMGLDNESTKDFL